MKKLDLICAKLQRTTEGANASSLSPTSASSGGKDEAEVSSTNSQGRNKRKNFQPKLVKCGETVANDLSEPIDKKQKRTDAIEVKFPIDNHVRK